jgi:hypothetical protein
MESVEAQAMRGVRGAMTALRNIDLSVGDRQRSGLLKRSSNADVR